MGSLVEQLIGKMGLHEEPNLLSKSKELLRLLELRATLPLQVNDFGKIVLCVDIAASQLGIPFDKAHALKISCLRKSHYSNNKRMIEKLLDLNKIVGVNDICIQLNLHEVQKKATELLELYKNVVASENDDIDITHPQYAAIAVFYACKLLKKKVSKPKLMPFSNLRPSQWLYLEQHWDKFLSKHYKDTVESKLKTDKTKENEMQKQNAQDKRVRNASSIVPAEDYESWKKRMLAMAEKKLNEEKENMILGI